MTVTATNVYSGPYTPNGATTAFAFTFKAVSADEVAVFQDDAEVSTALYNVTLNAGDGGTVTFTTAPATGTGEILILSDPDFTQQQAYTSEGPFSPRSLNTLLDRAAVRDLWLKDRTDRALRLPLGEEGYDLPSADELIGNYLVGDAEGRLTPSTGTGADAGLRADLAAGTGAALVGLTRLSDATVESIAAILGRIPIRPERFGAVPYNPSSETWTHVALQAFFDHARTASNARKYLYDWSGEWGIADKIWANYANSDGDTVGPYFIPGTLRVAPIASLPGGVALDAALDIVGYAQRWLGQIGVHPSGTVKRAVGTWKTRRFVHGVRIRASNAGVFEGFKVDDAIRWGVLIDSNNQGAGGAASFTVRTGTAHQVTYVNSNCIGTHLGNIHTQYCGSQHRSSINYTVSANITAKAHGTGDGASFVDSGGTTGASLDTQRTRLTIGAVVGGEDVADTTLLAVGDTGKMRHEIAAATFGTIAIAITSGAVGTITWSTGDPVAEGLVVGDSYWIENTDTSTTNEAIRFEITGFSGGSNRVISYFAHVPAGFALTAQAARSDLTFVSDYTFHTIKAISSSTTMEVHPWVPARHNSAWRHICGGSLKVSGRDCAWVTVQAVKSLLSSTGLASDALYGPQVDMVGADFGECGIDIGVGGASTQSILGPDVDDAHLEGTSNQIWNHSTNASFRVSSWSALSTLGIRMDAPRSSTANLYVNPTAFGAAEVTTPIEGTFYSTKQRAHEGAHSSAAITYRYNDGFYLSNEPRNRRHVVHTNTATVDLHYNERVARLFAGHHRFKTKWTGPAGLAPTGTLTINMTQELTAKGWTFAGDASGTSIVITAPGGPVTLEFEALQNAPKVICVTRSPQRSVLRGSATYDPPNLAAGAIGASTTVTVTGAALGDHVRSTSFSLDTQGVEFLSRVSAANTVTIIPRNPTAGAIDLASGTLAVVVEKAA